MKIPKCKHCGAELKKVALPPDSDWNVEYLWICMNDDCSYYQNGWDWMWNKFKTFVSYRYFYNSFFDTDGPFPVAKPEDLKDAVIQ